MFPDCSASLLLSPSPPARELGTCRRIGNLTALNWECAQPEITKEYCFCRFAFAVYRDKETAKGAVEKLNATQVPGHPDSKPVRVVISSVKNRLFVGNIPKVCHE